MYYNIKQELYNSSTYTTAHRYSHQTILFLRPGSETRLNDKDKI